MPSLKKVSCNLLLLAGLLSSQNLKALPIGFGYNQGDIEFSETLSKNFSVYHNQHSENEARMVINSLEMAKPVVSKWLGINRDRKLPVVISSHSQNASFANFIMDSIELQTKGQGDRDLFWHEYIHTSMYEHFNNWLGPAGALIHLPWMPAWFIEGLAEALSVSTSSSYATAIERYNSQQYDWPTYDSMHNLYGPGNFSLTGYALSGSFVRWILTKGDPSKLPELLEDFYIYSMPWFWPWAAVPFNGFMPMDAALETYAGMNGEELYETYKKEMTEYWKKKPRGYSVVATKGSRVKLLGTAGITTQKGEVFIIYSTDNGYYRYKVKFDEKTGWMIGSQKTKVSLPEIPGSFSHMHTSFGTVGVVRTRSYKGFSRDHIAFHSKKKGKWFQKIRTQKDVSYLTASSKDLFWLDQELGSTRFCYAPFKKLKKKGWLDHAQIICPLERELPSTLEVIGTHQDSGKVREIWIRETIQKLEEHEHRIYVFDTDKNTLSQPSTSPFGKPLSYASTYSKRWMLVEEATGNSLLQLGRNSQCTKRIRLNDLHYQILSHGKDSLAITNYEGNYRTIRSINPDKLPSTSCIKSVAHRSPLLAAMIHGEGGKVISLADALKQSDFKLSSARQKTDSKKTSENNLSNSLSHQENTPEPPEPASFRAKPLFLFPWMGAEDSVGNQYGLVSVPLMDDMQNNQLRATFLYGSESNFPNTDLSWYNTRFWPTITTSAFRKQTWNGIFYNSRTKEIISSYLDEKGASLSSNATIYFRKSRLTWTLGVKSVELEVYSGPGPGIVKTGSLTEPTLSLSFAKRFGKLSSSLFMTARGTSEYINENFDYNALKFGLSLSHPLTFIRSSLSTGFEFSRTRGKKMRALKEIYQPLKTFIPGSGGGYNQNNFELAGTGALFGIRYGDTQARAKLNWTTPLISHVDKHIWIFYLETLNFTAFANYGTAWSNASMPDVDSLIFAHGYNLDLLVVNKGVHFNVGLGAGQVENNDFDVYAKAGFDALF